MEKAAKELNVPYIENGSMVTAFSEKEKSGLSELVLRGRENGVPGLEILTGSDARRIEPFLSENVVAAMLCRRAAIISPYELAIAAVGNAMDNGVTFKRNFDVCEIIRGEYFTVKAKNGQQMDCKYLINCAGGRVDEIARLSWGTTSSASFRERGNTCCLTSRRDKRQGIPFSVCRRKRQGHSRHPHRRRQSAHRPHRKQGGDLRKHRNHRRGA